MKPLIFGSLFSGVGGLDLGLERAGLQCAFQVEFDDYCRDVLARHWPHVPRFIDVRDVGGHNLPHVDLLVGGFPCQDLSSAGRRAGIVEGTRSGLWFEYARLISELQPQYVLIENVEALRHKERGLGIVLNDLSARGYHAQWDVLSAAHFGAPHLRERIFIFAERSDRKSATPADSGSELRNDAARTSLFDLINREASQLWKTAEPLEHFEVCGFTYRQLPRSLRVVDGISGGLDEKTLTPKQRRVMVREVTDGAARVKGCGNAVSPPVAEHVGRCIAAWHQAH